jgi:hypothetical protein
MKLAFSLLTFSCFFALASAGCGGGTTAGTDAGGGGNDAGSATDTGAGEVDSGVGEDAAVGVDAATVEDDAATAGDDAAVVGTACTDSADMMLIDTTDVTGAVGDCAMMTFAAEPGLMDCIVRDTGLTAECSGCYDQSVHCVFMHCLGMCAGGDSPACTACRMTNCDPAFAACSGL